MSYFSSSPKLVASAAAYSPTALASATNYLGFGSGFGSGSNPAPQVSPQAPALQVSNPALQVSNPALQVSNPSNPMPVSAPRKRITRAPYDPTKFSKRKSDISTQLLTAIKSCNIFSMFSRDEEFDGILEKIILAILPGNIESTLTILNSSSEASINTDISELAAYICRKFLALSVNYPGIGVHEQTQVIPNLRDILEKRNTELTVKKCVRNPRPENKFECALTSIGSSIELEQLRSNLANEFISANSDEEGGNPPFPCYSIGNYLYSIGPMILDPRSDHIGRNLIMIRVLNYKNHIYPQGIYFWVYPSSSEGGLSRIFFKLPGGVTGSTFIKGTDYFEISEEAALESAINEFSRMAQTILPTIISDYETFVCFLGNMPHLQKRDIARYLPTITVSNRYCYQFDMTQGPIISKFTPDTGTGNPTQSQRDKSTTFFNHIFDNGFNRQYFYDYQRGRYSFAPTKPDDFTFTAIVNRLKLRGAQFQFDWFGALEQQNLQPVCSFSCIHIDTGTAPPRGTSFEWLIQNWHLTHNVQGVEIFGYPHPTVCTLTGALAYVVGHRGNLFLNYMVSSSPPSSFTKSSPIVVKLLPPLPITRLTTFSDSLDDKESMAPSTTRWASRYPYNTSSQVIDASILQGPEGTVLTRHMENLIINIGHFFKLSEDQKAKLDPGIMDDLKVCLLTFLDISPTDARVQDQDVSTFFIEMAKTGRTGLQNLLSIVTTTTYVRTMAADTLHTYLEVQPIPDALNSFMPPPRPMLMVQVSWLGTDHNYIPIAGSDGRVAFDYNNPHDISDISNIFNNPTFKPYIIEARRGARTFTHDTLSKMTSTRGFASNVRRASPPVGKIPVTVINKTMLFRVILYNDIQPVGPESVKFGALEVIVSISSTAVLQTRVKSLEFGTDVQFSVVSITACRHIRNPDGSDKFEKFQTFHGTNADIESLGMWGTHKSGDYAATIITYDQFHPILSEFLRLVTTMDDNYNNTSVSPYNTPDHWIMKLFAPVLIMDDYGQGLRDKISNKWEWPSTIAMFYQVVDQASDIVTVLAERIKNIGNILRWAAHIFFSDQNIRPDESDEVASHVTDGVPSIHSTQSTGVIDYLLHALIGEDNDSDAVRTPTPSGNSDESGEEFDAADYNGSDGGSLRRKPRVHKTTRKYKRYRLTNKQKQKSTNANTKNKNKNIKTIKNNKRLGSNKSKPKSKSKSNLKCKRRMNMNTATRRRCRTT